MRRHKILYFLLRPLVIAFLFLKFGYRYTVAPQLDGPYIVLANHVTDFDPLFVAASFPKQMYFVASEHIVRWKVWPLLEYLVAPIIRKKGTMAASTVMEMLRAVKKGHNICMFAEGARSWDGVTAPILASTGKVIKSARCSLVTYRIEGGYFVSPNWSEGGTRRGPVRGSVVNVYSAEEIAQMSVKEINTIITNDLHEDAYARQETNHCRYKGRQIAVKLENLLFRCPNCGATDTMESRKDTVTCRRCGQQLCYTPYGKLVGHEKFDNIKDLFAWFKEEVLQDAAQKAVYTSDDGILNSVEPHQEIMLDHGPIALSEESLTCGSTVIPLAEITDMAMHGRHALVFSTGKAYYELLPQASNALKFHMLYQAYRHGTFPHYSGRLR